MPDRKHLIPANAAISVNCAAGRKKGPTGKIPEIAGGCRGTGKGQGKKMGEEKVKGLSAKQYLGQLEIIDTKIRQMEEELAALKTDACGISGIGFGREKVQTCRANDPLGGAVTRYMALNDEISAGIDRFADIKHQVVKEIQSLNNVNHIKVLFKVYVQYKSLKAASDEMGMSYQYVRNIHKAALAAFENAHPHMHYLT